MKIYVCVKQVPETADAVPAVGGADVDPSARGVMNPFDAYAVEAAVQTAEREGGEVIVVSVGRQRAVDTIRGALSVGATRGILVRTDRPFLDSAATALALKAAIEGDGVPDLIFTGKQSVDTEGMQTHYRLAAAFGMPVANEVVAFSLAGGKALAERDLDGGDREILELTLPCVIGATRGLNEPRYPRLPDLLKAKKKPVTVIDLDDPGIAATGGGSAVARLAPAPEHGAAAMLTGTVDEMVRELIRRLKVEAKVL